MGGAVGAVCATTQCRRFLSCMVEIRGLALVCASSTEQEILADDGPEMQMLQPMEGSSITSFPSPAASRDAVYEV